MSDKEEDDCVPVLNITYYDTSDEESDIESENYNDDLDEEEDFDEDCDDETKDKLEFLEKRLEEVADVEAVGISTFRVRFFVKHDIKFLKRDMKCDFDYDDDDYPMIYDGGEDTFLPYMKELCKKCDFLSPVYIITNVTKEKYSF